MKLMFLRLFVFKEYMMYYSDLVGRTLSVVLRAFTSLSLGIPALSREYRNMIIRCVNWRDSDNDRLNIHMLSVSILQ